MRMNEKLKDFYQNAYPFDREGGEIDAEATFQDLFYALDIYRDVYEVMGENVDSVVRERLFSELARIMSVDYDYVYDQWMLG